MPGPFPVTCYPVQKQQPLDYGFWLIRAGENCGRNKAATFVVVTGNLNGFCGKLELWQILGSPTTKGYMFAF